MVRSRLLLTFALVASITVACASPATTPPTAGTPAHLASSGGDHQSGAAGTRLPTPPAVLVTDAAGQPVPGIAVQFHVDSGGGSLAAVTGTTGTDGVAVSGAWTLGPAAATTNVVTASYGSLVPVTFHALTLGAVARPLFTDAPVGSAGGTLRYQHAGDPLNGLTIVVPAGAYLTATTWSVIADSSVRPALPADFVQVGPTLIISNGQGYADSSISLTMPMTVPGTDAVAPFYFDPVTGTLELIPILSRDDSSASLATRHFSADLMAIPGLQVPGAGLRMSSFGSVRVVWVRIPSSKLAGTFDSGFRVGTDNWEFENRGDYISSDGDCEGMSITEIYYYYFFRLGGKPALYHHFDTSLANQWDNVQGIRYSGSVQGDYEALARRGVNQLGALIAAANNNSIPASSLTSTSIVLSLKLTQQPILLALLGPVGGHAVVAYSVTTVGSQTTVSIADPNYPATPRTMVFSNGVLTPVGLAINANSPLDFFTRAYALGVTSEVPLRKLDARATEFFAKQSGNDRYPSAYAMRVRDSINQSWRTMAFQVATDTIRTTSSELAGQMLCSDCGLMRTGVTPPDLQYLAIYNDSGRVHVDSGTSTTTLAPGRTQFVMAGFALSPTPGVHQALYGFVDSKILQVIYQPFRVFPGNLTGSIGAPADFAATNGGLATPTSIYTWNFGDGTPPVSVIGDSTVRHTFAAAGTFAVQVTLTDAANVKIGIAQSTAKISSQFAWRFTSASVTSVVLPAGGIGSQPSDTVVQGIIGGFLSALTGTPANNAVFVSDSAGCGSVFLEEFAAGAVMDTGFVAGASKVILAANCYDPAVFIGTFTMGPLGAGQLSGSFGPIPNLPPNIITVSGASIASAMNGTTLSGSFTWNIAYSTGVARYTVTFQGIQIIPRPGP